LKNDKTKPENGRACGQSTATCSLLPCPFCGSIDLDFYEGTDRQATAIYCNNCAAGVEHSEKSLDELCSNWNNRIFQNKPRHPEELSGSCCFGCRQRDEWNKYLGKKVKNLSKELAEYQ